MLQRDVVLMIADGSMNADHVNFTVREHFARLILYRRVTDLQCLCRVRVLMVGLFSAREGGDEG